MRKLNKVLSLLLIGLGSSLSNLTPLAAKSPSIHKTAAARVRQLIDNPDHVQQFADTLVKLRAAYDKQLLQWDDIFLQRDDVRGDADYYKLIMPATYYYAPIRQAMGISDWQPINLWDHRPEYKIPIELPNLERSKKIDRWINRQLLSFYVDYPSLVLQNEERLQALEPLANELRNVKDKKENILNLMQVETAKEVSESDLVVYKPNFWTKGGSGYLQFSQNAISSNWYKGGGKYHLFPVRLHLSGKLR